MTATQPPVCSPHDGPQSEKHAEWVCDTCQSIVGHLGLYAGSYGFMPTPGLLIQYADGDLCVRCSCNTLVRVWHRRYKQL